MVMAQIGQDHVAALLKHVGKAQPELLPVCRWLVLGPQLAPLIFRQEGREPVLDDLVRLLHLFDGEAPELESLMRGLVADSELGAEAGVEVGLDRLIATEASKWFHPTQVLSRPYPDPGALLAGCNRRLESAGDKTREQFLSVRSKLQRAVRIESQARRRRDGGWSGD